MMLQWSRRVLMVPAVVALVATPMAAGATTDDLRWELDSAYGDAGRAQVDGIYDAGLVVLPNGRAYLMTEPVDGPERASLARFTPSGELDRTFGDDGYVPLPVGPLEHLAIELQRTTSGRRLVVSQWTSGRATLFHRFRMNGNLDRSFGDGGVAGIFLDPDIDMTVRDLAIGNRRSIVAAGECSKNGINDRPCILSLTADGQPDDRFADNGFKLWGDPRMINASIPAVAVSADGSRIYIGGKNQAATRWLIGAFDRGGRLDETFGDDGRVLLKPRCGAGSIGELHPEATGELIATGARCVHGGLARLTHDGILDPTFGDDGWVELSEGDSRLETSYDPTTRSVYWLHDESGDLHVGGVQSDGTSDPAFGPEGELVLEVGAENFWNRGIGLDKQRRIYGTAWYPPDDLERVLLFRAVKVDGTARSE